MVNTACEKRVKLRVDWVAPDHRAGRFLIRLGHEKRIRDLADRYPPESRLGASTDVIIGPDDAIDGVTFEQYVLIEQLVAVFRVRPSDRDSFATVEFRVAPGAYAAIAAQ